jgi:hypothetical protein
MNNYLNEFSYLLSIVSLVTLWLIGNKNKAGFVLGLLNQILWTWYALTLKQYGLLVGVIAYTVIYIRNLIKWNKDEKGGGY